MSAGATHATMAILLVLVQSQSRPHTPVRTHDDGINPNVAHGLLTWRRQRHAGHQGAAAPVCTTETTNSSDHSSRAALQGVPASSGTRFEALISPAVVGFCVYWCLIDCRSIMSVKTLSTYVYSETIPASLPCWPAVRGHTATQILTSIKRKLHAMHGCMARPCQVGTLL